MRKEKYNLILDDQRFDLILISLIEMKNSLLREGRYTDFVDEVIIKLLNANKKYI